MKTGEARKLWPWSPASLDKLGIRWTYGRTLGQRLFNFSETAQEQLFEEVEDECCCEQYKSILGPEHFWERTSLCEGAGGVQES